MNSHLQSKKLMLQRYNKQSLQHNQLNKLKLSIQDNILYPSKTAILYLKQHNFTGLIYVIGSPTIKTMIRNAGYDIIQEVFFYDIHSIDMLNVHPYIQDDGQTIDDPHELLKIANDVRPVKAVYIDTDFNLSYLKLLRAIQYLKQSDCLFLVGPTDFRIPIAGHFNILGELAVIEMRNSFLYLFYLLLRKWSLQKHFRRIHKSPGYFDW